MSTNQPPKKGAAVPEKNFAVWVALWESLPEPLRAAIMAWVVAMLRIVYDRKEPSWMRRLLESSLCGAIGYGVAAGAEAFGLAPGASIFFGSAVGLLGVDWVRVQARRVADKRISQLEAEDE